MLLHIPGKDANALEVNIGISARFAFTDDVPVDLTRQRILYAIDRFDRRVDVTFTVLRNLTGDVEL